MNTGIAELASCLDDITTLYVCQYISHYFSENCLFCVWLPVASSPNLTDSSLLNRNVVLSGHEPLDELSIVGWTEEPDLVSLFENAVSQCE